jgi:tetratricopeptide (TPR) repeat protein
MSLIVDVLKMAQKDAVAKRPLPSFVNYPHKEGLCLRAVIFKHVWLFRGAMGLGIVIILMVLMMTLGDSNSSPRPDVFNKPITRSQKISVALPETHNPHEKSAPVQKEKIRIIVPEKRIAAPSQKGKKMKSENAGGKILLKKSPFQDVVDTFNMALSHQKRGEKEMAVEGYKKIIEMDPMNVEAHTNLGVIYKDMGKLEKAVKEFQMVLSMNPRHEKAHNNLGVIFYLRGNLEKAIQKFREVLDINPRNKEAYINLGVIYKQGNLISKAKRIFEKALSIDPYSPEAHYNLGLISEESGDIKAAISCYRKFIDFSGSTYPELAVKVKSHLEMLTQAQKG